MQAEVNVQSLRNASCCMLSLYICFFGIPVKQQSIKITHFHSIVSTEFFIGLEYNVTICLGSHGVIIRRYNLQILNTELRFICGSKYYKY
jgi:hypothetical protein